MQVVPSNKNMFLRVDMQFDRFSIRVLFPKSAFQTCKDYSLVFFNLCIYKGYDLFLVLFLMNPNNVFSSLEFFVFRYMDVQIFFTCAKKHLVCFPISLKVDY